MVVTRLPLLPEIFKRNSPVCVLLAAAVLFPAPGATQQVNPKKFYETDYAVAPNYRPDGSTPPQQPQPQLAIQSGSSTSANVNPNVNELAGNTAKVVSPVDPASPAPSSFLELFVSSANQSHFEKVVSGLINFIHEKRTHVTAVYHIGDFKNVRPELQAQLEQLGVTVLPITQPPPNIKVEYSPAWVLHTMEGQYIIEGALDVAPFVSPAGEYTLPARATPVPTVQAKIEGF
jgi:hypothetical protein